MVHVDYEPIFAFHLSMAVVTVFCDLDYPSMAKISVWLLWLWTKFLYGMVR